MDKFYDKGMMGTYIKLRNSAGAGKIHVYCAKISPTLFPGFSPTHLYGAREREPGNDVE